MISMYTCCQHLLPLICCCYRPCLQLSHLCTARLLERNVPFVSDVPLATIYSLGYMMITQALGVHACLHAWPTMLFEPQFQKESACVLMTAHTVCACRRLSWELGLQQSGCVRCWPACRCSMQCNRYADLASAIDKFADQQAA